MTTVNHRRERIGEEIAHEINAMLAGELKDPRLEISVVVNEVRVAPDGRNARVFVGARGTAAEQRGAIKALEHASSFIRHEILERLQRIAPVTQEMTLNYLAQNVLGLPRSY